MHNDNGYNYLSIRRTIFWIRNLSLTIRKFVELWTTNCYNHTQMSILYYNLNQQQIVEAHTFISEVKTSVSAAHYPLVQFAGPVLLCPYRATALDCSRTMATLSHRDTSAPQTLSHQQALTLLGTMFLGDSVHFEISQSPVDSSSVRV